MRKHETAVCGTARTVVWEVGKCENRRQMPFMISIYLLPDYRNSVLWSIHRGCVISLWRTLFVFSPFSRYGTEKIVFIYNKAQTFTSSGFAFPQKNCIFAENFFKYGKDTNKI